FADDELEGKVHAIRGELPDGGYTVRQVLLPGQLGTIGLARLWVVDRLGLHFPGGGGRCQHPVDELAASSVNRELEFRSEVLLGLGIHCSPSRSLFLLWQAARSSDSGAEGADPGSEVIQGRGELCRDGEKGVNVGDAGLDQPSETGH